MSKAPGRMSSTSAAAAAPFDPRAAQALPIPQATINAHRAMLQAHGPHRNKDRVLDRDEPDYLFDVKAIEEAIASSALPVRHDSWPTGYARRVWGVEIADNLLQQAEESSLDLIWAASMPDERAATPVLVIEYAEGLSFFDGSHRLVRALLDGSATHPALVFRREDALSYRERVDP